MKLIGKSDTSMLTQYSDPVMGGEYTGFVDNFIASTDGVTAVENSASRSRMRREVIDPILEEMKVHSGMDDFQLPMYLGDQNHWYDENGKFYRGQELTIKRILDYAKEHEDFMTALNNKGIRTNSVDAFSSYINQAAADKASEKYEEWNKVRRKQTTGGLFGEFFGSMFGFMQDPADLASVFIPLTSKSVVRNIAAANGVNLGIELFEYDEVRNWHNRVTGEDYTPEQFRQNLLVMAAGTTALVGATEAVIRLPFGKYITTVEDKIRRRLTDKEKLQAINNFEEAYASLQGRQPTKNKDLQNIEDMEQADEILTKDNYLDNDALNTKHKDLVNKTLDAILRNDFNGIPKGQTMQKKIIDDVTELEKQTGVIQDIKLKDIVIDDEFQFKATETDLSAVKEWDDVRAGQILIFQDKDGKLFVVDGHARVKLAKRLKHKGPLKALIIRDIQGFDKETAKLAGVIKNFHQGTIEKADLAVFKKYPGTLDLIKRVDPGIQLVNAIRNLMPRAMHAVSTDIIDADTAAMIASKIPDDEVKQLHMMNKILNAGITDEDEIARLIDEAIASKLLDNETFDTLPLKFKASSFDAERNTIINDLINRLDEENSLLDLEIGKLKQKTKTKNGAKYDEKQQQKFKNQQIIQLIRTYGGTNGEISDIITNAAIRYANEGARSTAEYSDEIAAAIRRGLDEGGYNRLLSSYNGSNGDLAAEIARDKQNFSKIQDTIVKYSDVGGKGHFEDNKALATMIEDKLMRNSALRNRIVYVSEAGEEMTVEKILAEVDDLDGKIQFLKGCPL